MKPEEPPLPEPLNPPEVDLRGYDFMPFYGEFLRRSKFNCRVTDAEFRAAVNLWWSSWWQVPAASLPMDDRELCKLADVDDMRKWRRIKAGALAGFVQCSDKRLHHAFLSVLARDAFSKRKAAAIKGHNGAVKRWNQKGKQHSAGNATGNASAIPGGMPQPSDDAWHRHPPTDSKGEESLSITNPVVERSRPVDKSQPREGPTSTPRAAAHSIARTQQQIAEQRAMVHQAAPMPDHVRAYVPRKPTHTSEEPTPQPPQGGDTHGEESLDT
jgi:hypothetical protein